MEEDPADGDAADASGSDEGEGAGVDLMGNHTGDEDSSEEESEGSDAEREVRAGESFSSWTSQEGGREEEHGEAVALGPVTAR